ncbi:TOM1-like protein 9 [Diospyros lotus]|uniref:TOM1-like protein 9 n=1 Tax=Diospyros lotus TaxID=55363 RepID=UPI00225130DF|nr:TOM1-like protein 9 [Diospyros lotus]
MVNLMVERATSNMLVGPDWAMNVEICNTLNRDPLQSKDVVKGIKKRLRSKNPKAQLLSLILLETLIKNCGDLIHMQVAEKDLPHEMVKIVKKKPDFRVKEMILILIDTWQEAFGGPRARYPQFYAAYQELLRAGAVFPQRTDRSTPIFALQSHHLGSYPQNIRTPEHRQEAAESSAEDEFPTLSLTEIQNARDIMDVLADMLNALDPANKEGLREDVIAELVEQCRVYKQRVVHLVNSTLDESLLCQGLSLNDELQCLLAKHEAIASGASVQTKKLKPKSVEALADVDVPLIDTGNSKQSDQGSTSDTGSGTQLLLPAPATNGPATTPTKVDAKIDLLSGDDFNSPSAKNTIAISPAGGHQPINPVANQQNALALVDMFSQIDHNQPVSLVGRTYTYQQQQQQQHNFQSPLTSVHPDGIGPNMIVPQDEQSLYTQGANSWNGQISSQQQPPSPVYGAESSSSLPPPPWEAQPTDDDPLEGSQYHQPTKVGQEVATESQPMFNGLHQGYRPMGGDDQVAGMYIQQTPSGHLPAFGDQADHNNQLVGLHPQAACDGQSMGVCPQQMQSGQMHFMYQQMYSSQMGGYGYGYGQQQNDQFLELGMSGLSVRNDRSLNSYQTPALSYVPSGKPSRPEDKLFGDLVAIAKVMPTKT